ncbi:MAG TPA: CpsB/CapC family capsule biosynthesis tyrosine phosphatase [Ferruginibacter sp.]|nr:CpsB/CapC family capsule biosynthesis tyrosine phosphatase [Ferruginibacter sp.]
MSLALPFTTDIHSHILPGIDDGSPDVETSIMLIRGLMSAGITKSIATPHIIGDMYRNNSDTIFGAMKLLQDELDRQGIEFELSAAAEYMMDAYFIELLNNKTLLLTVKDKLLLTEFSYSSQPAHPEKMSFSIIMEGYTPILAHPERYGYYHDDFKMFHRLKDLGFLLQVNLLSLTGYYGKETARAARYIIKNDLASYVGTDMHHVRHLAALLDVKSKKEYTELLSGDKWNEFFDT